MTRLPHSWPGTRPPVLATVLGIVLTLLLVLVLGGDWVRNPGGMEPASREQVRGPGGGLDAAPPRRPRPSGRDSAPGAVGRMLRRRRYRHRGSTLALRR